LLTRIKYNMPRGATHGRRGLPRGRQQQETVPIVPDVTKNVPNAEQGPTLLEIMQMIRDEQKARQDGMETLS
jgi:hypothetical protein